MTNLLATILFTLTTNWVTVSTTYPVPCQPGTCVYHPTTDHQVGTVCSNTVAVIKWRGRVVETVLESVHVGSLYRDVLQNGITLLNANGFTQ